MLTLRPNAKQYQILCVGLELAVRPVEVHVPVGHRLGEPDADGLVRTIQHIRPMNAGLMATIVTEIGAKRSFNKRREDDWNGSSLHVRRLQGKRVMPSGLFRCSREALWRKV